MRKLCFVAVLCLLFMSIEVLGGIKANSLAILTDAAHLLTDVAAFAISMLSLWASSWEPNPRHTITRLIQETNDDVDGFFMVLVACFGTTIKMIRSILEVQMESKPREINAKQLEKGLMEIEEVLAVHELHIWAVTVGKTLFSCHVKIRPEADDAMVLNKVIDYIWREYHIGHVTIQIER
ncbi:unnamed protein product [Arabis nemorensis]|uniref:Cation efflux protein cytoplasmic domain-containing protein n=1 Tax=Arabis nemorensis TaxID=586526 RepID=A0A565BYV0_9BRAS|nr:unnamed protein product [Arabis nemorensis]